MKQAESRITSANRKLDKMNKELELETARTRVLEAQVQEKKFMQSLMEKDYQKSIFLVPYADDGVSSESMPDPVGDRSSELDISQSTAFKFGRLMKSIRPGKKNTVSKAA